MPVCSSLKASCPGCSVLPVSPGQESSSSPQRDSRRARCWPPSRCYGRPDGPRAQRRPDARPQSALAPRDPATTKVADLKICLFALDSKTSSLSHPFFLLTPNFPACFACSLSLLSLLDLANLSFDYHHHGRRPGKIFFQARFGISALCILSPASSSQP